MKAMKKTVLATAVLMSMGAGAVEAAVLSYDFSGAFVMFDGSDPTFSDPYAVVENGNGLAGDPVTGTMTIDSVTGNGTATIVAGSLFFGSAWYASEFGNSANSSFTVTSTGVNTVQAHLWFHWGDPAVTSCGVVNCDIEVTLGLGMTPGAGDPDFGSGTTAIGDSYSMLTLTSDMPGGPFAGFQPTFNGTYTVAAVPVPATAWIVGSGLLGLMGVGATRRKKQLAA